MEGEANRRARKFPCFPLLRRDRSTQFLCKDADRYVMKKVPVRKCTRKNKKKFQECIIRHNKYMLLVKKIQAHLEADYRCDKRQLFYMLHKEKF